MLASNFNQIDKSSYLCVYDIYMCTFCINIIYFQQKIILSLLPIAWPQFPLKHFLLHIVRNIRYDIRLQFELRNKSFHASLVYVANLNGLHHIHYALFIGTLRIFLTLIGIYYACQADTL